MTSLGLPSLRPLSLCADAPPTMASKPQTRFAPLNPRIPSTAPPLKGIVFDVDGTLWSARHLLNYNTPPLTTNQASRNTRCSAKCGIAPKPKPHLRDLTRAPRTALGIPKSVDILHHVRSLPTPTERALAAQKIRTIEQNAMLSQEPQPGLVELMEYLRESGVRRGLCTRNFEYAFSVPHLAYRLGSVCWANGTKEHRSSIFSETISRATSSSR